MTPNRSAMSRSSGLGRVPESWMRSRVTARAMRCVRVCSGVSCSASSRQRRARLYDLRHAAVSLWRNAGVPATQVAERAGHSVDVLLRVYAKCIDGGDKVANMRIDTALREF